MSVRWDPLLAAALSRELSRSLLGSSARSVLFDSEPRRLLLYTPDHTLAIELHPLAGWVSLLPPSDPLPGAHPLKARITGVRTLQDESALVLDLSPSRGKGAGAEIVIELVGNRWNALLVEGGSRAIRHVLHPRGRGRRPLQVGARYEPPPSTGRRTPTDERDWAELTGPPDGDAAGPERSLLDGIAWASSLNAPYLSGPDGFERWREITTPTSWGAFLLPTAHGLQPYPVGLNRAEAQPFPSLIEAFSAARERSTDAPPLHSLSISSNLVRRAELRIRRLRARTEGLRRELEATVEPGALRETADLILARFREISPRAERVVLEGFDGGRREVTLDPALPPAENASRYYAEAARVERARHALPERIREAEERAERWTKLVDDLGAGRVEAAEVVRALGRDPAAARGTARGRKGTPSDSLPYRRFRSSGGLEIRVGKNAQRNDDLTFHHSSADDVWLHAQQAAGAHVILRWNRKDNPPGRDLMEAAALAALHSEARHSGSVAVTWTRRKHVRKPRKSGPGSVVAERVETLFVEPDPTLLERLLWGEEEDGGEHPIPRQEGPG
ncbi:MAG: DUF814 domain-containing protein [Gemmatimonadetes bacterium]|nr:DUF814 domain-containing protein [Gemmatimonadota bacterium]